MITLQFVPHNELVGLSLDGKMAKILRSVKDNKIVLIEGKLGPVEEAELIARTMAQIDKKFSGIEICVVEGRQKEDADFVARLRSTLANLLLGKSDGLTIVGPASLVKEIKKDPHKIELFTTPTPKKRRR